jgi:hypothetical protein
MASITRSAPMLLIVAGATVIVLMMITSYSEREEADRAIERFVAIREDEERHRPRKFYTVNAGWQRRQHLPPTPLFVPQHILASLPER